MVETHIRNRSDISPLPTGVTSDIHPLGQIKAVIFDIYGTLLVSGSGDVGTSLKTSRGEAFLAALFEAGISDPDADVITRAENLFFEEIRTRHSLSRQRGVDYPEVDILSVWDAVLRALSLSPSRETCVMCAIAYEVRANPVRLMPGARAALRGLGSAGMLLGIVSNAQFFTQPLLEYELGVSLSDLGLEPALCSYSFQAGVAKPSTALFTPVLDPLKKNYGIEPSETVYVGNDMLNDVYTASKVGCRTCLFAGDKRSLRLRSTHELCSGLKPDTVITELSQLLRIVSP